MKSNKFIFTQTLLNQLPCPSKGKRAYYKDEKVSGLILDVRSSGSKSFYLYKKIAGKPERIFIGLYPDMKVPDAREFATIKKGEIAKGNNPQDERRKISQEITFGELFNDYMERYSKIRKKSWIYDEREVNKFLASWFKSKVSNISKQDVQRKHEDIGKNNGLYQANRILERIRAIYNKGIEWGLQCENPAVGIKKFKEKARDRFALQNELPFLFYALEKDENEAARDYFLISLMTGVRKSNTLVMRWDQVNWHQKHWRIPDTKNDDAIIIPLLDEAMGILERRKRNAKNEFVFDGEGKKGHLADPKHAWERIRQTATLEIRKLIPDFL